MVTATMHETRVHFCQLALLAESRRVTQPDLLPATYRGEKCCPGVSLQL